MKLYAKRIEGRPGVYRLHTNGCKAVRFRGHPVHIDRAGQVVLDGDFKFIIPARKIESPCRSCKAAVSTTPSELPGAGT